MKHFVSIPMVFLQPVDAVVITGCCIKLEKLGSLIMSYTDVPVTEFSSNFIATKPSANGVARVAFHQINLRNLISIIKHYGISDHPYCDCWLLYSAFRVI